MRIKSWLAVAILVVAPGTVTATTIYKSVDAKGRVTFSDQPPEAAAEVEILEYREPPPRASGVDLARIEAMREVTDRMAADRREREESRARQRAARSQYTAPPPYPQESGAYGGWYQSNYVVSRPLRRRPGYGHPGHGRPGFGRPGYGHPGYGHPGYGHPGHGNPGIRPPYHRPPSAGHPGQRPRYVVNTGRYNQYPANLVRRHYQGAARRVFYGPTFERLGSGGR